ncbi:hypothetical protein [Mycobacterium sp. PSTR-4-N]|uniref:hypothetical protein n=1 Tax=Mycobacterium sp. PSTR-4-N TaxID=2917745 RepID=UPI0035AF82F0
MTTNAPPVGIGARNTDRRTADGYTEKVTGVAFSPDGERIVSSRDDGTVRLSDSAT